MDSIIRDGVVWDPINHELYGLATIVMMMRSISNQSIIPIVMKYMIICYAYVWFFACLTCLFVFLNIFRRLNIRMYSLERVWIYVLLIRDLINWLWYMHVLCVLKRMEVKYNQRCMSGLDNAPCQMFSLAATTSAAVTVCLPILSLYSVVICLLYYSPGGSFYCFQKPQACTRKESWFLCLLMLELLPLLLLLLKGGSVMSCNN